MKYRVKIKNYYLDVFTLPIQKLLPLATSYPEINNQFYPYELWICKKLTCAQTCNNAEEKKSLVSVADNNSYGQLINACSLIRTAAGFVPINYVSIVAESLLLRR